jgi:peptidoglycan hydrolase-like protein with peptidoglycan-binding domain
MPLQSQRFLQNGRLRNASDNNPALRQGESGEAIVILQLALIDLGRAMPRSTRNGQRLPDGIFGPETLQAVKDFQKASGLVVDGVVGRATLAELERQIIDLINRKALAADVEPRRIKAFS